jgi:23S rRNA pseudouridine1911/1915/1917 synthase
MAKLSGSTSGDKADYSVNEVRVETHQEGMRLDAFISAVTGFSRSFIQHLINKGLVVSPSHQKDLKQSTKVKAGVVFQVKIPPPVELEIRPEPVDFKVVYEDPHIIVLDKPAGLVVHPAPGNWEKTLVHGLLYRYPEIGRINNVIRPGIVHRLDSTTSGLMVVARSEEALSGLQLQFKNRLVTKIYLALADGKPGTAEGQLNYPVGRSRTNRYKMAVTESGRPSRTDYRVLWTKNNLSLISCTLHSGRTHQIRVHFKQAGCPLVGDRLYGNKDRTRSMDQLERIFLHSWKLGFEHPVTGEKLLFISSLPAELVNFLRRILSRDQAPHTENPDNSM